MKTNVLTAGAALVYAVFATPLSAAAQTRQPPADLDLIEKVEFPTPSTAEAVGASKAAAAKAAAANSRIDGIRLTASNGSVYFVRDEKREGIARRTDGPEIKGQAPTMKIMTW